MNKNRRYGDLGQDSALLDGVLLNRFYSGDGDALGELANRVGGRLVGRAVRLLSEIAPHRQHIAEDMVSEAFLRVFKTRDQGDARWAASKATVMAWMTRILRNAIVSELRGKSNAERTGIDLPEAEDRCDGDSGRWETQLRLQRQLADAMPRLPEDDRRILELAQQGLRQNAIARRLGMSTATVSRRLKTTKQRLRALRREDEESI